MENENIIAAAIECEEYKAQLRAELAEWKNFICGEVPKNRAATLITNDQKEGE